MPIMVKTKIAVNSHWETLACRTMQCSNYCVVMMQCNASLCESKSRSMTTKNGMYDWYNCTLVILGEVYAAVTEVSYTCLSLRFASPSDIQWSGRSL